MEEEVTWAHRKCEAGDVPAELTLAPEPLCSGRVGFPGHDTGEQELPGLDSAVLLV